MEKREEAKDVKRVKEGLHTSKPQKQMGRKRKNNSQAAQW